MAKSWYQKMKEYAANAPKFEKCKFPTCTNEVLVIGKKYCGKKDCPKIAEDKLIAKFGKEKLAEIRKKIKNE